MNLSATYSRPAFRWAVLAALSTVGAPLSAHAAAAPRLGAPARVLTLTPGDAAALADPDRCPAVAAVAPIVHARTQVAHGGKSWVPTFLYGTTPDYLVIRDWAHLAEGKAFTDRDVREMREVCLVGRTVARRLFGGRSPVGQQVLINGRRFTVLGVLSARGANRMGLDQDDVVLAPWTTVKFKVLGPPAAPAPKSIYPLPTATGMADAALAARFVKFDQILVKARSAAQVPAAIRQINEVLRERHRIRAGQPDDWVVRDLAEMSRALGKPAGPVAGQLLVVPR
jgi:hypothetical protein